MKEQPAKVSYFFDQGYTDLKNTIRDSWKANWDSASESFEKASYVGWIKKLFWWGTGIFVVVFGTIWFLALSLIHILILFTFFLIVYFLFTFVWVIDYLFRVKEQVFAACPNPRCHKKSALPVYHCPKCDAKHTQLWPSKYGILKRTCECGEKLPCTFFNKRGTLRATCPHCGKPIGTEEGTPVIVPLVGPPTAGKTSYLYSLLENLQRDAVKNGYEFRFSSSHSELNRKLYEERVARLNRGEFVGKTVHDDALTAVDVIISKGSKKYAIYFYDPAGESFEKIAYLRNYNFYEYYNAMIFLMDPFAIEEVRNEYYEDLKKNGILNSYNTALKLEDTFNNLKTNLSNTYNIKETARVKHKLAVVIPKTDLYGLDKKFEGKTKDKACRSFLIQFGQKSFVDNIDWKFRNVRFFNVASKGEKSVGVMEPFNWILESEMRKTTFRRFFSNLLMTFFIAAVAGVLGSGTFFAYKAISGIQRNQIQAEITESPIEHAEHAFNYYCNATTLNVRDQPNVKGKIIGQLKQNQGCYVSSFDLESKFAAIDFHGATAYVSAEYLKPISDSDIIPSSTDGSTDEGGTDRSTGKGDSGESTGKSGSDRSTDEGGSGESQNENKLVELRREAEQGDAEAQTNLGNMYYSGSGGVSKDYAIAAEWYRKAAEQGFAQAQTILGNMYYFGIGVSKDYTIAAEWYRKAAEQGFAWAQNNLGDMYDFGHGVSRDDTKAVEWYHKAAEQGFALAQNNLGNMYYCGYGVSKDYAIAAEWYRKAAEQGLASAQNNLGAMYYSGYGVSKDYTIAAEWYRKAAEQGFAEAQNNLGAMYRVGQGVRSNYAIAAEWYRKAAEQGHASAQNNLGFMYNVGYGVSKNYFKAAEWYQKAAEQGNVSAQNNLGFMYEKGHGVSKDDTKAVEWYRKAAEQGLASAQNSLGNMYRYGYGVRVDHAKAMEWYRKATEQGDVSAQKNIGDMYFFGYSVSRDFDKAVEWYRKAAAQGDKEAKQRLKSVGAKE
jgi:TPR repeat protein